MDGRNNEPGIAGLGKRRIYRNHDLQKSIMPISAFEKPSDLFIELQISLVGVFSVQ